MVKGQENEQFQLLEEKVDSLITYVKSIKEEKESLIEKIRIQEEKITNLTGELEEIKSDRNMARQRIISLLEKLEQLEI
ncbi:MAG: cell division protein ZapB [Pseudomonadota bacterium]